MSTLESLPSAALALADPLRVTEAYFPRDFRERNFIDLHKLMHVIVHATKGMGAVRETRDAFAEQTTENLSIRHRQSRYPAAHCRVT